MGLAAALGASGIVDAGAETSVKRAYVLSFKDVEVQTASLIQLRRTLQRKAAEECEVVRPCLEAFGPSKTKARQKTRLTGPVNSVTIETEDRPIPIVIGTVFYARRVLRVSLSNDLSAQAKISWGDKFLRYLGLGSSFKVNADLGDTNSVEFIGDEIIPVAYAPAFLITQTRTTAEAGKIIVSLHEIIPKDISTQMALLKNLLKNKKLYVGVARSPAELLGTEKDVAGSDSYARDAYVFVPTEEPWGRI